MVENKNAVALYDSGANISMIHLDFVRTLNIKNNIREQKYPFRTMSGVDQVHGFLTVEMKIMNIKKRTKLYIIENPHFKYDILLGLDTIYEYGLNQDHNLNIFQSDILSNDSIDDTKEIRINWNENIPISDFIAKTEHLTTLQADTIYEIIDQFESLFARNKYDIGKVKGYEAHIQLLENKYVAKKPYRCSLPDQKEIEKQIAELLNHGIIEESCSSFAAPVTLAYKKEGDRKEKSRFCIDFRELNKLIVPESQPFPKIEDIIIKTRGNSWFTSLDINSAFWSIPVRQKDRYKLGFVTQTGHYQWSSMPFGLKNAPASFQRILSGIIRRNHLDDFCTNYIDDLLVFSASFDEHVKHLKKLFSAIHTEGFRVKFSKCQFAVL